MRFQRCAAAVGLIVAGALLFSACGSDNGGGGEGGQAAAGVPCGGKPDLRSSGSTAQANAMTRFVTAYEGVCAGQTLNYTSNGSGAGRNEFIGGQTDLGGSDSALSAEQVQPAAARCAGAPAWNLPLVFGPLAVTYNLPGVTDLVLDGATAAKLFNGQIKTWNDPALAALNPGKPLPATPVAVLFRSDQSGTTDNFQKYLQASSNGAWTQGAGQTFNGGVGAGARGNEGTSAAIKTTPGSITYNEWSFAKQQGLAYAQIINSGGGQPVTLTAESAGQAIAGAQFQKEGNDLVLNLDSIYKAAAPGAYPISLATYEIVCSKYPDPQVGQAVKAFLSTALNQGQQGLADNGYIPLPEQFKQRLTTAVSAVS